MTRGLDPNKKLIRKLRKMEELSQDQLAAKTGLHRRTIENIEKGNPTSMQNLKLIAQVLRVKDPNTLVKDDDNDTVLVIAVSSDQYKTLDEAMDALEPRLQKYERRYKVIRIEYGSILVTIAVTQLGALKIRAAFADGLLADVGVFDVDEWSDSPGYLAEIGSGGQGEIFHAREGDQIALKIIASPRSPQGLSEVRKLAYKFARRPLYQFQKADAEDIASDVVLRVLTKRVPIHFDAATGEVSVEGPASLAAYVNKTVQNEAWHRLRTRKVYNLSWETLDEIEASISEAAATSKRGFDIEVVEAAMRSLSPDNVKFLQLYMRTESIREMASEMGVTPMAVRQRLHKIRKHVRKLLGDYEP